MAKIHEELVVLKLSKLVRESDSEEQIATDDMKLAIESLLADLADNGLIIEVVDLSALGL